MVLPKYFLLTARKILILPKSSKLGGAIAPPAPPAGTAMALTAPQELQLVLIDLQSDYLLKEKFQVLKLNEFYALLNDATFPNMQKMAQRMLVLFGSTYICEQTFSLMNFNKSNHKSRSTDTQLKSVLTIATTKLSPDFDTLAKKNVA